MSDSDSSVDETKARLLAAVDTSFLSDTLYQPVSEADDGKPRAKESKDVPTTKPIGGNVPKSNRYLPEDESVFHSDLNVPAAVQKFTGEKISKLIETMFEFDDSVANHLGSAHEVEEIGLRLLAGAEEVIDLSEPPVIPRAKPKLKKRRKICDDELEPSKEDKIASSACAPSAFAKEVKHWKEPRRRSKLFQYKEQKNGTCVEVPNDLPTEFSKERIKNRWDESKIRQYGKRSNIKTK